MATFELILLLLAAVLVSAVVDQLVPRLASPLIQIGLGLFISVFFAGKVNIELENELFFLIFIAPLLYHDASECNKGALMKNIKPVMSLAIGLVIVTALVVGFVTNLVMPVIPLATAIALGAALGPTDAVAVQSLPKTINISKRQRNLLQGECLINDASGVVSFQFAVAFFLTGTFSILDASVSFVVAFFGGILVGVVLGFATNLIIQLVRSVGLETTTFHVLFDIFTPFIVFLAAEPWGASGVIAVVVAGIVSTLTKREIGPQVSRQNIVSTSVWRVFSYALNGIVFVLLGTQLPNAMVSTWEDVAFSNVTLVALCIFIAILVMGIRFAWLLGIEHLHRPKGRRGRLFSKNNVRSAALMTFAGAKGTVTLVVILTLPVMISDGSYFAARNLIIFLACGVILITLLLANFAVPAIAPKRRVDQDQQRIKAEEDEAHVEVLRWVIEELVARETAENRRATQSVINSYVARIEHIKSGTVEEKDDEIMLELKCKSIHWQQEYINMQLVAGKCDQYIALHKLYRLSHRENLLKKESSWASFRAFLQQAVSYLKTTWRRIVNGLPLVSVSEQTEQESELMIASLRYANQRLSDLMLGNNSDEILTEHITKLMALNSQAIARNRISVPSVEAISEISETADNIQRRALSLELEGLIKMYNDGRITRGGLKEFRENIAMMQLDLDERI